jgi:hypothetical protein
MQLPICAGVHPGLQEGSLPRRIGGRLAARRTAWYSGRPETAPPGGSLLLSPAAARLGSCVAGLPSGPITFGSQS